MSLLMFFNTAPPTPTEPVLEPLPHLSEAAPAPWPTAAPWTPQRATIPTYEGSGSTVHYDVVDMVKQTGEPFRGYRYWLAHTPYPHAVAKYENPSIAVSNNLLEWHDTSVGLSNPVVPEPPIGYHSDPILNWDHERKQFSLIWRDMTKGERIMHTSSPDGEHWSEFTHIPDLAGVSPSIRRIGPNHWRAWVSNGEQWAWRDASHPLARWAPPTPCEWLLADGTPAPKYWHGNVAHLDGDTYLGLFDATLGVSRDAGKTWTFGQALQGGYRGAIIPDGDYAFVLDSLGLDTPDGRSGFPHLFRVPLSAWAP